MSPRIKKPPAETEQGRRWLQRHEDGESVRQIAKKDGYDVRTVRKHIERVRQAREIHEARAMVLRNALEDHYRDICGFAKEIEAVVSKGHAILPSAISNPLWTALRQHLPKAPLWKGIEKWDHLDQELDRLKAAMKAHLEEAILADDALNAIFPNGLNEDVAGIVEVLERQMDAWLHGSTGLDIELSFKTEPADEEGYVRARCGAFYIGTVKESQKLAVREALTDLQLKLPAFTEYESIQEYLDQKVKLGQELREELTTIILRRVVPGRCRYCPI